MTVAELFARALAARSTKPRLRVGGWSWGALLAGRVAGLLAVALGLAIAYFALIALDRPVGRMLGIGAMLVVTATTAVTVAWTPRRAAAARRAPRVPPS